MSASGVPTAPLVDRGDMSAGALTNYDINRVISKWMRDDHTQKLLRNVCSSHAEWEEWAELELECEFRDAFGLPDSIRGVDDAYKSNKLPTLVLPKTAEQKGMVIELKCENALGGMGAKLGDLESSSVYTKSNISDKYSDYVFVVLAMAFTDEADEFLRGVGMEPIPGAEAPVATLKTVKMYREDFKVGSCGFNFVIADFVSATWTGSESR
jgi:hypothetical protein